MTRRCWDAQLVFAPPQRGGGGDFPRRWCCSVLEEGRPLVLRQKYPFPENPSYTNN